MHDDRKLQQHRLRRTLIERITGAELEPVGTVTISAWHVTDPGSTVIGGGEPVPFAAARAAFDRGEFVPFDVGQAWGPVWGTTWFHLRTELPAAAQQASYELQVDLGWADHSPGFQAEGLVRRPNGTIIKAINPRNQHIPVTATTTEIFIEAAANPLLLGVPPFIPTADGDKHTASTAPIYRLARCELTVVHTDVRELRRDLDVISGLSEALPEADPRSWELLLAAGRALDRLDLADIPGTAAAARAELTEVLSTPARPDAPRISAVGHAHIDTGWLWPIRETRRKIVRTLANVVHLAEQGEKLVFALPAAQHIAWLAEDDPELFDRVKALITAGTITPVGGMWVEPDAVLPGGEALCRQFAEGQRFFREHFGITCRQMWLPDSFGYTAALPQLALLAGATAFLTQKISWNQIDTFPHHTLWWEGLDGSRIFTHFPPIDTYGAEASGQQLAHAVSNFKDRGRARVSLMPYGYGDGGGGPTREMLARINRQANLAGAPTIVHENPDQFFATARADYPDAPVWAGELYLELHRGTFTSQANTKAGNRRNEHLLREAELWCASAAARGLIDYPYEELHRIWQTVLTCQFHDILPGSSIAWVHHDAEAAHAEVTETANALIDTALRALAGSGEDKLVVNSGPFPVQVGHVSAPALGLTVAPPDPHPAPSITATDGGAVLDNGSLRVRVGGNGYLDSVLDLSASPAGREVLPDGCQGGTLYLHQDFPNMWDAWDVDRSYRGSARLIDTPATISLADGAVTVRRSFGKSTATVRYSLTPGRRQLDIEVDIDWQESEKFLKLAFPIDVHTDSATFESQFGHIRRATHENTSWDAYRFEVNAQRWVRVAEPGYGVALTNSATYGYDVTRHARPGGGTYSVLRASLLRAPRFPDPACDRGHHVRRFALLPGASTQAAIEAGYRMNIPLRQIRGTAVEPLVTVDGAIVESVKLADDHSGDVIVRLYEGLGARADVRLRSWKPTTATGCDLLEDASTELGIPVATDADGIHHLRLRPFQVATVRLTG